MFTVSNPLIFPLTLILQISNKIYCSTDIVYGLQISFTFLPQLY
jgi:hypothetical protein